MYGPSRRDAECCPVRQLVVSLPEQVDGSNADPIRRRLLTYVDVGVSVLIADMTGAISCDHAGADALARVYERAVANGTELRLVITAPAVRRVIAISGLDRLLLVFPSLAAAQSALPPAGVLRLPAQGARTRLAALAAVPAGSRPVSWLPVAGPATAVPPGPSREQAAPADRFAETLTQITGGIFQAALTLQTAIGLPSRVFAQAAEDALDLLDRTVSQARTAAFALAGTGADSRAGPAAYGAVVPPGRPAVAGAPAGAEAARRLAQRLTREARQARAQSTERRARSREAQARAQQARVHAMQAAGLAAATRQRIAAAFSSVPVSQPRHPQGRGEAASLSGMGGGLALPWSPAPALQRATPSGLET